MRNSNVVNRMINEKFLKNSASVYLLLSLFFIFLFSCGEESSTTSEKTAIKKDSLVPEVVAPVDTATEVSVSLTLDKKQSFHDKVEYFIHAYEVNYDAKLSEKRSVLDRFDAMWIQKSTLTKKFTVLYGETEVNPIAQLAFYEYKDSAQRANAMSNWLACFGNDCNEIVPGTDIQIKSTPGFYIINEKEMIALDYPLEHEKNNWDEMKKNLQVLFAGRNTLYVIEVAAHGKLKWIKK